MAFYFAFFFSLRELILRIEVNPQNSQKLELAKLFSCYTVPFLLTSEDLLTLHSPLKTSIKYGLKEYGFTPEDFSEN